MIRIKRYLIYLFFLLILVPNAFSLDLEDCNNKEKEYQKLQCFEQIAINSNNPKLCKNSERYSGHCYSELAKKINNVLLCENADKFKYECYLSLAIKNKDYSLCNMTELRKCVHQYINSTKDYNACKIDRTTDECYLELYEYTRDKEICKYIENQPEDCLCKENEYLNGDKCILLNCNKEEIIKNHKCVIKCPGAKQNEAGECLRNCDFGFKAIGSHTCTRDNLVQTLFIFSIEFTFFFVIFLLLISFFKFKFMKKLSNFFKKDTIIFSFKFTIIYLVFLIFLILLEGNAGRINYNHGIEGLSLLNAYISILPFIIGAIVYWVISAIRKYKNKYINIFESLIIATALTLLTYPIKWLALEKTYENLLHPLYMLLFINDWFLRLGIISYYILPFIETLYIILFFTLIIFTIRYVYTKFLKYAVLNLKNSLPQFIKDWLLASFVLMPIIIFVFTIVPSVSDFADLLFELGINVKSADIREFYALIIYSFFIGIIFNLAKLIHRLISKLINRK